MISRRATGIATVAVVAALATAPADAERECVLARDAAGDQYVDSWHVGPRDPSLDLRSLSLVDDGQELVLALALTDAPVGTTTGRVWTVEFSAQGVITRLSLGLWPTGPEASGATGPRSSVSQPSVSATYRIDARVDAAARRVVLRLPYRLAGLRPGLKLSHVRADAVSAVGKGGLGVVHGSTYVTTGQGDDVPAFGSIVVLGKPCR